MNLSSTACPSPHEYASPHKKPDSLMKHVVTNDSSNEREDAECIAIVDGCSLMEDCKTPEQEGGGRGIVFDRFSARPMNEPPLLKPRRSSLHQEYRSWNAPMEEPSSSFCSSRNAPLFPDSPSLAQRRHVVTDAPWFTHQAFEEAAPAPCPPPSRSASSLPRRVLLSFQDCHIVRLPPRLSRSDGYLHDISWRLQMAAGGASSSSLPTTSASTPCRKKSRTETDWAETDDMPLLTPVEGYTIPNAPYATFFSQEDEEGPEHPGGRHHNDVLYWDSATDSAGSSRVATPLPLLDIDDDSEASSDEGCRSSMTTFQDCRTSSASGTAGTITSTTARLLPVKPPKLKMRTNHPVLLQSPSFASLQLTQFPDGNTA
jgi:hypothetical protein